MSKSKPTLHERVAASEKRHGGGAYDPRDRKDWNKQDSSAYDAQKEKPVKGGSAAGAAY